MSADLDLGFDRMPTLFGLNHQTLLGSQVSDRKVPEILSPMIYAVRFVLLRSFVERASHPGSDYPNLGGPFLASPVRGLHE